MKQTELPQESASANTDNIAIRVQNPSKCHHIYDAPRDRLKQFVAPRLQRMVGQSPKEALNKLIPFMVRQAHHERNQQLTVRPELVEGFNQRFPKQYFREFWALKDVSFEIKKAMRSE